MELLDMSVFDPDRYTSRFTHAQDSTSQDGA